MITFGIGLVVGIGIGWVAFERPELVTELIEKAKEKWRSARS